MPQGSKVAKAEAGLKKSASKKHLTGKRKGAYVYGTLNKLGLMRGNKATSAGKKPARTVLS